MQVTVNYPDTIAIGRNGTHGTIEVDWTKVPQDCLQHIVNVYVPQYFSDAANAGGKEATSEDRLEIAAKKRQQLYDGVIRARSAGEPADPFEAECYREAKRTVEASLRTKGLFKDVPKGTKDRFMFVVNRARAAAGKPEATEGAYLAEVLEGPAGADIKKRARAAIKAREIDLDGII